MAKHVHSSLRNFKKHFGRWFGEIELFNDGKKQDQIRTLLEKLAIPHNEYVFNPCTSVMNSCNKEIARYRLRTQKFLCGGGNEISLQQREETFELFDCYFKDRDKKLCFVPDIDLIWDNLLYKTTEDGKLMGLTETGSYQGEVVTFIRKYVSQLRSVNGIMLKSYSNKHFATILDETSIQPGEFETDWLYLGRDTIVAIEIGLCDTNTQSNNPCNQTVRNKLIQVLERTVPHFQSILYSLINSIDNENKDGAIGVCTKRFQVVVVFPNISFAQFQNALECLKKDTDNGQCKLFALNNYNETFWHRNLFFALQPGADFLYKIDQNLTPTPIWQTLSNLLASETVFQSNCFDDCTSNDTASSSESTRQLLEFQYVSALITLSSLNFIDFWPDDPKDRDLDKKYRKTFCNWKSKQDNLTYNGTDFILSPEQHRILANDKLAHLLITGEPGSGKTSLLLAKCQMLAEENQVQKILYLVRSTKTSFLKMLHTMIKQHGSELLKQKIEIVAVDDDHYASFCQNNS